MHWGARARARVCVCVCVHVCVCVSVGRAESVASWKYLAPLEMVDSSTAEWCAPQMSSSAPSHPKTGRDVHTHMH